MSIYRQPGRPLRCGSQEGTGWAARIAIITAFVASMAGCNVNSAMEELSRARQSAADLLVQFTKAADASNRAVMADTDEMSIAFAREAEHATEAVQADLEALAPLLQSLRFSEEAMLLDEFG